MRVGRRARRGEFNLTWLIVAVIAVVLGIAILYYVYVGGLETLGVGTAPAIDASEAGGVVTVNIRSTGIAHLEVYGVLLYSGTSTASCSSVQYLLDGQAYTPPSSGPLIILKPGQTLTVVESSCSPPADEITTVVVITNNGKYTVPIS